MEKTTYYTQQSLDALRKRLSLLEKKERPILVHKMQEARSKGDLKENAEYHTAKEELALMDIRIYKLKEEVTCAQVLDMKDVDTSKVSILTKVTLENVQTGQQVTYHLVSGQEANIREGKISVDSPVARGLLGKKKGEIATVKAPVGDISFKVVDITTF